MFSRLLYNERGTLVLIALLVMSSLLMTVSLVSTLVIRQLRFSKDIENGLIAYYASESAIEESLYSLRKGGALVSDLDGDSGVLSNTAAWNRLVYDKTKDLFRDALFKDQILTVDLYNPADFGAGAGAAAFKIGWVAGSVMKVTYRQWDKDNKQFIEAEPLIVTCSAKPCNPVVFSTLNPAFQYQILVQALGDEIHDLHFKAYPSTPPADGAEMDIPTPTTIRTVGVFASSRQGLEVTIPRKTPW